MIILLWVILGIVAANAAFFGGLMVWYLIERRREKHGK